MGISFQFGKKIFNTAFNKNGYRLLEIETKPIVYGATFDEGARAVKTIKIEGANGIKTIDTFLNSNGKTLYSHTIDPTKGITIRTRYFWHKQKKFTSENAHKNGFNPLCFENQGLQIHRRIKNNSTSEIIHHETTTIDINMPTRTVTRSSYKRDNTEINKKNYIHEQSSIDEIVNGRKTKGILQRSLHEPEQTPTQIGLNHYGISDSNVNKIISDPNFRTRFAQGNIFQQIAGIDAAQAQRVKPGWRMRSAKKTDNNNGSYNHSKRLITMKYLEPGKEPPFTKTKYFETLNHEMRHAWQRQLVEDLEAGKLTNPEEIKMAKTFQHNFKNQVNSSVDYDGYFNQPVEVDARRAGLEAALNYSKATRFLEQTFNKALDRTLGA